MLNKIRNEFDGMYEAINASMGEFDSYLEELEIDNAYAIKDVNDFIFEMKKDGIYSDKIQEFINHYLKYHND